MHESCISLVASLLLGYISIEAFIQVQLVRFHLLFQLIWGSTCILPTTWLWLLWNGLLISSYLWTELITNNDLRFIRTNHSFGILLSSGLKLLGVNSSANKYGISLSFSFLFICLIFKVANFNELEVFWVLFPNLLNSVFKYFSCLMGFKLQQYCVVIIIAWIPLL